MPNLVDSGLGSSWRLFPEMFIPVIPGVRVICPLLTSWEQHFFFKGGCLPVRKAIVLVKLFIYDNVYLVENSCAKFALGLMKR